GVADDRRYPIILACAAVHASWRGELEDMRRYADEAVAAQERLTIEPSGTVMGARGWVAMVEGRVDDYERYSDEAIGRWRAAGNRVLLAQSLANAALARALKGEDMGAAVAEADESLALGDVTGVPILLIQLRANAAFVLADVQPERARALMNDAVRRSA